MSKPIPKGVIGVELALQWRDEDDEVIDIKGASAQQIVLKAPNQKIKPFDSSYPTDPAAQVWQIATPGGTPAYVDETVDFNSATANDVDPFPAAEAVGDLFAVGFAERFSQMSVNTGTAGDGSPAVTWKYWDGSAWSPLLDVSDGTSAFTATGAQLVTWTVPKDWTKTTINGSDSLFYVAAEVATVYGTTKPKITTGSIAGLGWHVYVTTAATDLDVASVDGTKRIAPAWEIEGNLTISGVYTGPSLKAYFDVAETNS